MKHDCSCQQTLCSLRTEDAAWTSDETITGAGPVAPIPLDLDVWEPSQPFNPHLDQSERWLSTIVAISVCIKQVLPLMCWMTKERNSSVERNAAEPRSAENNGGTFRPIKESDWYRSLFYTSVYEKLACLLLLLFQGDDGRSAVTCSINSAHCRFWAPLKAAFSFPWLASLLFLQRSWCFGLGFYASSATRSAFCKNIFHACSCNYCTMGSWPSLATVHTEDKMHLLRHNVSF